MKKSIYTKHQKKLQKLLKGLRLKVGLSQERLAKILGKPQSFVSKYESGERRLDLLELRQICEVLDESHKEKPVVAIIGRFIKDTILERTQIFEEGKGLIESHEEMRSSPSAIFALILN